MRYDCRSQARTFPDFAAVQSMLNLTQGDGRNEIAEIEARIEDLEHTLAGCRKVELASKAAVAVGAVWLALLLFGVIFASGLQLVAALTLVIGGIVAFGSNASTERQTRGQIAALEARRDQLIDAIDPHLVAPERSPTWLPRVM
jgi:hypothetical protein